MASEIKFEPGKFLTFKAKVKFHLGPLERDVEKGEEFDFDGTTVKFPNNETHSIPKLRGCISAGWMVLSDEDDGEVYRPKPAGITVRAADPMKARAENLPERFSMENVSDEETVVTATIHSKSGAQIGDQSRIEPNTALTLKQANVGGGSNLGSQEGKEVSRIGGASGAIVGAEGTAGMATPMVVTSSNIGRLKSEQSKREEKFGSREVVKSEGSFKDLQNLNPELKARLEERRKEAKEAEKKARHGGDEEDVGDDDDDEGIDFGALGAETEEEASPSGKKKLIKKKVQKKLEPVQVDWDMTRHWTKRVKDAVENYADKPRHLRKILAMEKPSVSLKIQERLEKLGL